MTKLQNTLRVALTFAGASALLLAVACGLGATPPASLTTGAGALAASGSAPPEQTGGIAYDAVQVTGFGKATAVPDVATLSMEIEVIDATVAEARARAAASLSEVLDALAEQEIAAADIATSHFRIYPDYDYSSEEGRELRGYQVSNGLRVKVRNTETERKTENLGPIIDAAIAAGGDDIVFNRLSFSFSDTSVMEQQARDAAVADLEAKASQLATAAGRELGDLKLLTEGAAGLGGGGDTLYQAFALEAAAAAYAPGTPITAGEGEVTVVVFGVYELLHTDSDDDAEQSDGSQ